MKKNNKIVEAFKILKDNNYQLSICIFREIFTLEQATCDADTSKINPKLKLIERRTLQKVPRHNNLSLRDSHKGMTSEDNPN